MSCPPTTVKALRNSHKNYFKQVCGTSLIPKGSCLLGSSKLYDTLLMGFSKGYCTAFRQG